MEDDRRHQTVIPAAYAGLRGLVWNRDPDRAMPAADAFSLYERNWRHVDVAALTAAERDLIADLAARFGNGVMPT